LTRTGCTAVIALAMALGGCLEVPSPPSSGPGGPDAGLAAPPVGSLDCAHLFGDAPGFILCGETPTSCELATEDPDDRDYVCRDVCGAAPCLTGYDSDGLSCQRLAEVGCDALHESQICVCARGPSAR